MNFDTLTLQVERSGLQELCKKKDEMLVAKESKMSEKDRDLVSIQQKCDSLQSQVETFQRMNQSLEVSVLMAKQSIVLCTN